MKMNIPLLKRLRTRFLRMRHPQHLRMKQIAIKTDCGAAMCMIGHVLDLEGYKMRLKKNYGPGSDYGLFGADDPARTDYDFLYPKTRRVVNEPFEEAANLLDMGSEEAGKLLFYRYELITPKQAAARIQELIKSAEAKERQ